MPEMKDGESQSEWMKRCVPVRIKEGNKQDQAVAVCASMWRKKYGGEKPKAKTFDEVMKAGRTIDEPRQEELDELDLPNRSAGEFGRYQPNENDLYNAERQIRYDEDRLIDEDYEKLTRYPLPGTTLYDTSNIFSEFGGMEPLPNLA
jgi:hypothetical protein